MVTLREIAEACGYSTAAVSKALRGLPDIAISTAEHIKDVAHEMGYKPNIAARTLKTGRSHVIGILFFMDDGMTCWTSEYFSLIAAGAQMEVENRGYDVAPVNCYRSMDEQGFVDQCRSRGYDGLIIMNVNRFGKSFDDLLQSEFPVVTVDESFSCRSSASSDNEKGMRDLLGYVYGRGHRRVAFIHGTNTTVTRSRVQAFRSFFEERGIKVPEEYLISSRYKDPKAVFKPTQTLLALPEPPTCILYPDDFAAIGGYNAFLEQGLVPAKDISFAGYDGVSFSQAFKLRLTTIKQDAVGIGREAAKMLLREIEKPNKCSIRQALLPGTLLEGNTVADIR